MPAILIVEDDSHQRLLIEEELQEEGYCTLAAANGREAIETVERAMPDLVVLDLAMPGVDGIELLSKLLSMNNELPIVIHSAFSSYQENFMTWAADAYIIKHSSFRELKTTIRDVLARHRPAGTA